MKNLILTTIATVFLLLTSCVHSTPNNSDAKEAARAAIIHNLKDPTSAKFYHNETINNIGNNTFVYTETLIATNSFGGSIVQNVTVKVKWKGGNPSKIENWEWSDLQIIPRK